MKLTLEFNDRAKSGIKKTFISKTVKETLLLSGRDSLKSRNVIVSVAFVSEEEIQELNRIYRKKDQSTDVLSFAEYKNSRELEEGPAGGKETFLGELVLCYNDIRKYCRKNKVDVREEMARVVSHGMLHLLGFSHGKKMFEFQDEVAKKTI